MTYSNKDQENNILEGDSHCYNDCYDDYCYDGCSDCDNDCDYDDCDDNWCGNDCDDSCYDHCHNHCHGGCSCHDDYDDCNNGCGCNNWCDDDYHGCDDNCNCGWNSCESNCKGHCRRRRKRKCGFNFGFGKCKKRKHCRRNNTVSNCVSMRLGRCDNEVKAKIVLDYESCVRVFCKVVDCCNRPVPCASVQLLRKCGRRYECVASGVTDCNGCCVFEVNPRDVGRCLKCVARKNVSGKSRTMNCRLY